MKKIKLIKLIKKKFNNIQIQKICYSLMSQPRLLLKFKKLLVN